MAMEAIMIEATNKADVKFWLQLAKKTGVKAKAINTEEIEDKLLAALIENGLRSEDVDRSKIMKALGR